MILVYKTSMHAESQLNSSPCGPKADPRTRHTWLIGTLSHLDQYPPTNSPSPRFTEDTEMEADPPEYPEQGQDQATTTSQQQQTTPEGRGTQPQGAPLPSQTADPIHTTEVK